ncbi:MAG TPA: SCO family protein [Candidatus Elarobacter sp.]|jgi:cytochrome oxidase Cu insertion factor (SCO1/SenC/PrrC family)
MGLEALALTVALAVTRDARDVPIVDQLGTTFTLRELHRPTAVTFIDLDCDDACTIAEGVFARLAATLAKQHVDARLVTITLSPQTDSPIAMASRARTFNADAARWRWASGRPADVEALMGAFHVVRVSATFHSTFAYVLDAHGLPVRTIPLSTNTDKELLDGLRAVAQQRRLKKS